MSNYVCLSHCVKTVKDIIKSLPGKTHHFSFHIGLSPHQNSESPLWNSTGSPLIRGIKKLNLLMRTSCYEWLMLLCRQSV